MNALVRKEIRLLLPTWIVGLVLAVAPGFVVAWLDSYGVTNQPTELLFICFGVGMLLLSLAAFGQEMSAGTFSMLLAQPVKRSRLWRAKVGTLCLIAFSVWAAFLAATAVFGFWLGGSGTNAREYVAASVLIPAVALGGALWTTILFRQVALAFWLTLVLPLGICLALGLALSPLEDRYPDLFGCGVPVFLILYGLGGFHGARRMFFRAQDVPWTGATISLPAWLVRKSRAHATTASPKRQPIKALIRKEVQSQHPTLLLGGVLLLLHVGTIALRKVTYNPAEDNVAEQVLLVFCSTLWLVLPAIAGSIAVAEERRQGTLESQLSLPISRTSQWVIKLATTMLVGTIAGSFMPILLERMAVAVGVPSLIIANGNQFELWQLLISIGVAAAGITFVAFYASSLTRNVLQAISTALIIAGALTAFWVWTVSGAVNEGLWRGPLIGYVTVPVLLGVLLYQSLLNCQMPTVGPIGWLRNLAAILGAMALIVSATAFSYHRWWDYLTPPEPRHGQATLSGSVRPKICLVGDQTVALLPDGRLWASSDVQVQDTWAYETFKPADSEPEQHRQIRMAVPTKGVFSGGTNWVDLARSFYTGFGNQGFQWADAIPATNQVNKFAEVIGLKADGTLWKVFTDNGKNGPAAPEPERLGTDSDWAAIAGGGSHFLALKRDGSLWGWGVNGMGQLGPERSFADAPSRIGTDTDWISIFVKGATSTGVKRDGSVWRWGAVLTPPTDKDRSWMFVSRPNPVPWSNDGTDWLEIVSVTRDHYLVLKKDGTFWREGIPQVTGQKASSMPATLAPRANYKGVEIVGDLLVLVESNGTLIARSTRPNGLLKPFREPSRYSDWLTASCRLDWTGMYVSLAADGTLSCWATPDDSWFAPPLLGPSRKPLWIVNILAEAARK